MSLLNEFSDKQLDSIRNSNNKINVWEGAVSSGKTYSSLWRWYKECRDGPPGPFAMLSKTYDTFKRNILPDLEKILGAHVQYFSGKRELYIKNRLVHIIGCSDERAEQKIRGVTFAGAYVDEMTLIPESAFNMLLSRLRVPGAKLFGTTNPDSPFHWMKKNLLDVNPDVSSWQFKMDDNPFLTADYKDFIKRQYKGLWYQRFIEGLWVQAEGAIYDMFNEADHVLPHPRSLATTYIVGVDYGTNNPCAFVLLGINRNYYPNIWVEEEYYYDSKVKQRQKTDSEYAQDLKDFIAHKHISGIYIDPSAASFIAELRKIGVEPLYQANNDVIDGIRFVSSYLSDGTLKICKKCTNLIMEFQGYVWDPKSIKTGEDRPLKQSDHALDALRYALFTHLGGRDRSSASARDLEQLYAETRSAQPELPRFFQDPQKDRFY